MIKTLEWTDSGVRFIDQTKLPTEETYVTCKSYEEVANAIKTMIVRGAPAIGVTAAMGVALGVRDSQAANYAALKRDSIISVRCWQPPGRPPSICSGASGVCGPSSSSSAC